MKKFLSLMIIPAVLAASVFTAVPPAEAAVSYVTRCNVQVNWGGTITTKYSNGVKLSYWSAPLADGATAYCFKAQRSSAPKNTYISLRVGNGPGNYGRLSTTKYFVVQKNQRTSVTVYLFKKSGETVKTYWRAAPIGIGG